MTVVLQTYNHARYIRQALESVLYQEVDFPYEVLAGDDYSIDGTREILQSVAAENEARIRLVLPDHNLGRRGNNLFRILYEGARAPYVALLEGDDYWSSPLKLQAQVELLDASPSLSTCYHNALVVHEDDCSPPRLYRSSDQPLISSLRDVLTENFIPTCALMVRKSRLPALPQWVDASPYSDWAFHVFAAHYGDIGYLPETFAVYRVHEAGIHSGASEIDRAADYIDFYDRTERVVGRKYRRLIRSRRRQAYRILAHTYRATGRRTEGKAYAAARLRGNARSATRPEALEFALKMYAPWLVDVLRAAFHSCLRLGRDDRRC